LFSYFFLAGQRAFDVAAADRVHRAAPIFAAVRIHGRNKIRRILKFPA
jgi:hypothetical protein